MLQKISDELNEDEIESKVYSSRMPIEWFEGVKNASKTIRNLCNPDNKGDSNETLTDLVALYKIFEKYAKKIAPLCTPNEISFLQELDGRMI